MLYLEYIRYSYKSTIKRQTIPLKMSTVYTKRANLETDFTPFTKINLKWILDLNLKCKSMKLLEDNIGDNLGYGDGFLDIKPKP